MDEKLDRLKKGIQSFFDEGTVTIVGSGLSCAEGISGMKELSEQLLKDVPSELSSKDMAVWEGVEEALNAGIDLESALQQTKISPEVENAIMKSAYKLISGEDEEVFIDILENRRELIFSEYLSKFTLDLYNLVVITTNYDLLIEYACESKGYAYLDSFYGGIISKYFSDLLFERNSTIDFKRKRVPKYSKPHINIYKPHGSINWKYIDHNLYKINHMDCGNPCIITPGSNKYERGYSPPFDYHIGKMGQEIDSAKRLVFLGYGFNDNHLETHLENNKDKPKLIVSKALSKNAKKIIKDSHNAIALEENLIDGCSFGTKVYIDNQVYKIEEKAIWNLKELIKEIFNE